MSDEKERQVTPSEGVDMGGQETGRDLTEIEVLQNKVAVLEEIIFPGGVGATFKCEKHKDEIITRPVNRIVPTVSTMYARFSGLYCPICDAQGMKNMNCVKKVKEDKPLEKKE